VFSIAANGNNLFAYVSNGGVYHSGNNGMNWAPTNAGLPANTMVNTFFFNNGTWFAAADNGLFISNNNGTNWNASDSGLPKQVTTMALIADGSSLFMSTYSNGIYLSTDNGLSWVAKNSGLPVNSNKVIEPYALATNDGNLFTGFSFTNDSSVYTSTNNGNNWVIADSGLTGSVSSFAVSGGNLIAGTYRGDIFLSSNNGKNWKVVNTGFPSDIEVNSMVVNGSNLFAGLGTATTNGTNGGVYISNDNGLSWKAAGLTNITVNCLAYGNGYLYAATDNYGIFVSMNNGVTWTAINTGL
jgi:photosystem II stability/assembly factor-like uncharacterized protein